MSGWFVREVETLRGHARTVNGQAVFVLTMAVVFVILHEAFGSVRFFHEEVAAYVPRSWRGLMAWGWRFGTQGVAGFVLPVACLMLLFRRRPAEIGLGLGDWRLALVLAAVYLPFVVAGTWVLSASPAFLDVYPHYDRAARDWGVFAAYELLFLFYWIGWEYLWRGFVLFGTAPALGYHAVFVQMVPFALLHIEKPLAEALLSVVGGVALGALVWRCRSFWIAVPIHAAQMLILDFWCTLRIRTGVTGLGLEAFVQLFGGGA